MDACCAHTVVEELGNDDEPAFQARFDEAREAVPYRRGVHDRAV
jgi:hypothetical protein